MDSDVGNKLPWVALIKAVVILFCTPYTVCSTVTALIKNKMTCNLYFCSTDWLRRSQSRSQSWPSGLGLGLQVSVSAFRSRSRPSGLGLGLGLGS